MADVGSGRWRHACWALVIVVSIKYAGFLMRAHNRGDGGGMALAALILSIVSRMRDTPRSTRLSTCVANSSKRSAPTTQASRYAVAGNIGVTVR